MNSTRIATSTSKSWRLASLQRPHPRFKRIHVFNLIYALAIAVSISVWFIPIHAPLWLDETGSYWQISRGLSQIWSRQPVSFPAYSYILWLTTKIIGTSEVALRIPSVLAMLAAAYLLYRAAREMFDYDIAAIATIIFCLHPIIVFASIDARPYAFAALATNAAIFALLRLRFCDTGRMAVLFGFLIASILYFQFLFAVIFPALLICFFIITKERPQSRWRIFAIATGTFALAALPTLPGISRLFRTSHTHNWDKAPRLADLVWTTAPGYVLCFAILALLASIAIVGLSPRSPNSASPAARWRLPVCASLALVPTLILYAVSTRTAIHIFAPHYCVITVSGTALLWGLAADRCLIRSMRLAFCVALVAVTAFVYFTSPNAKKHGSTWKYALQVAQTAGFQENTPVLVCSDFVESDFAPMPLNAKDSFFFTPLSYYKLSVPVVPMPRSLNQQAIKIGSQYLQAAEPRHQRFLAIADKQSYKTLEWLSHNASEYYTVRKLGKFDYVEVLEFLPRNQLGARSAAHVGKASNP